MAVGLQLFVVLVLDTSLIYFWAELLGYTSEYLSWVHFWFQ